MRAVPIRPSRAALAWAALALACATSAHAQASKVLDNAGMFSADAVRDAQALLVKAEAAAKVPVVIETIESLDGETIGDAALRLARKSGSEGVFLLLSKKDRAISSPLFRRQLASRLPEPKRIAIRDAFVAEFRKGDFDAGLRRGVEAIADALAAHDHGAAEHREGAATTPAGGLVERDRVRLTLAGARRALAAAEAKATEMNIKANIAVVDDGGHLLTFARMDGARPASATTAQTKAITAATFRAPTGPLPAGTKEPDPLLNLSLQNAAAATGGKITTLYGGIPIVVDGQVIGAVGVGGGSGEQDAQIARAGVDALLGDLNGKDE